MTNSDDQVKRACSRLADHLQSHKEALIGEWVAQARRDFDVPSDSLTKLEIVDHVPKIFDAMIQALRSKCSETTMEKVQEVAARHTIIRWVQRYDLHAVIREVSLLREEFIRHLRAFDEQNPEFDSDARLFNATTIHRILDDIVIEATDTFLKLRTHSDEEA